MELTRNKIQFEIITNGILAHFPDEGPRYFTTFQDLLNHITEDSMRQMDDIYKHKHSLGDKFVLEYNLNQLEE